MQSLDSDAWRFASILFLFDLSIMYFSNYNKPQVLLSLKFFPLALVLFSVVLASGYFFLSRVAYFGLGNFFPLSSQNHLV